MAILPLQLARVSNLLRTSTASSAITSTQGQLLKVQNELITGRRVNTPSDDAGAAAISQQLRKTLEAREAYSQNLKSSSNQLSEVDTTLGDLTEMLQQAQTIASANVGSDVTADQRAGAAAIVDSIYNQALSLANKQYEGTYLFGGDRATEAPFVETRGGVKFVGSATTLQNRVDEHACLAFQVNADELFNALSSRVQGSADLTPSVTGATRSSDLKGTGGDGVQLGSIRIGDGTTAAVVDLSGADTVQDVINKINGAAVGGITAAVNAAGTGLELVATGADDITVTEIGSGKTATDLGILQTTGAGAGTSLTGQSVNATVTNFTPLANLKAGAGIDVASGFTITNGSTTSTIDTSTCVTVEDLLNKINGADASARAEISADGKHLNIYNPTQGTQLTIAENGGTTAGDLGVRSFGPSTPLSELNNGKGIRLVDGNDLSITDSAGVAFEVDLSGSTTVQDVLDKINAAATIAGAGVTAAFTTTGNGISVTDTAAGAGTLAVGSINFSAAVADLGLSGAPTAGVITGADVNTVEPGGIFSNLDALRKSLRANDQDGITKAGESLQEDYTRVVNDRGRVGSLVKEMEARQGRIDDQNLATKSLLSEMEDSDYTDAIIRFQNLQTTLQASLQTTGKILNLSLLDFLG